MKKATEASECRSCGALILWALTAKGRRMPVNAGPTEDGSFLLTYKPKENVLAAEYILGSRDKPALTPEELKGRRRFKCHFETCPNAVKREESP